MSRCIHLIYFEFILLQAPVRENFEHVSHVYQGNRHENMIISLSNLERGTVTSSTTTLATNTNGQTGNLLVS